VVAISVTLKVENGVVPDHGHLERGIERELREKDRIVVEFGSEFRVQ